MAVWRWIERSLGVAVLLSVGAMGGTFGHARPNSEPAQATQRPSYQSRSQLRAEAAESLHATLVELAPFRPDRVPVEPGAIRVESRGEIPIRPPVQVSAIVWGRRPAAVLEGLPGVEGGRVVVAGDSVGALVVQSVGRRTVVVSAPDTSWVLKLSDGTR